MKSFIQDHVGLLVILLIFAAGFGFFIYAANGSSKTVTASEDTYKKINFDSAMTIGSKDAPVQIIQYSDFLCPQCTMVSTQVMPTIEEKYINTGKVAFEFRPMAFVAKTAETDYGSLIAAQGAYCAVDQGKFWKYHDMVYEYTYDAIIGNGKNPLSSLILTPEILKSLAKKVGLDPTAFGSCIDNSTHESDVTSGNQAANNNGITSAPTVLLNGTNVSSSAVNLSALEALIEAQ